MAHAQKDGLGKQGRRIGSETPEAEIVSFVTTGTLLFFLVHYFITSFAWALVFEIMLEEERHRCSFLHSEVLAELIISFSVTNLSLLATALCSWVFQKLLLTFIKTGSLQCCK